MSLDEIISLSCIAKEYYDFIINNNDTSLFDLSLKYVQDKQCDNIAAGYKERCLDILHDILENVSNSELFYQRILVSVSCSDIMIKSLYELLDQMFVYCHERVKKLS